MLVRAVEDRFSNGAQFAAIGDGLIGAPAGTTPFYTAVYDVLDGNEQNPRIILFETFGASVQALRIIMPPLGNDFIAMIKDSALVSVLGVTDITQLGKIYAAGSFRFMETYNVVAYIYLLVTTMLSLLLRRLEKHLRQNTH